MGLFCLCGQATFGLAQTWQSHDVGTPGAIGSSALDQANDQYTLQGSGADIWGTADGFHFYHRTANGDVNFTVRVDSVENTNAWAKAGIMLRESLAPGSPHVMIAVTPGNGVAFQRRRVADERSYNTSVTGLSAPQWVRLEKRGERVWGYASSDGQNWMLIGSDNFTAIGPYEAGLAVTSHRLGQLCTAEFTQLDLESDIQHALPAAWETGDVGLTGSPGLAREVAGEYTLFGAGADIWGQQDAFHFTRQVLEGDGSITARVQNVEPSNAWAKAGVMIRESLEPNARNAFLAITPSRGLTFQRRVTPGSNTAATITSARTAPQWVRLQRVGDVVTALESMDGIQWQAIGTIGLDLPSHVYVGLAMTSHRAGQLAEANFTDVTIETAQPILLPAPWEQRTIGDATYHGTASEAIGTFTVQASGRDIWSAADEFHYVYQPLDADGALAARVVSQTRTNGWAKAGLMIRETLETGSRHAMVAITPDNGVAFQRRLTTDGNSRNTNLPAIAAPQWLKIERWGRRIDSYYSADGIHWTYLASETLEFDAGWIGLAVTSHNNNQIGEARFDEIALTRELPPFGLEGRYHEGATLSDLVLTRIDSLIDFHWKQLTPDPAILGDPFSVRWVGRVLPEFTEAYRFSTISDDGVRLWVDGHLLIDDWNPHSAKENVSEPLQLEAGAPVKIAIEYFDRGGAARMALRWESTSQPKYLVPPHRLLQPEDTYAEWELLHFGINGVDAEADPDGDGRNNREEYEEGSDPNDYYNGSAPRLTILSGDQQIGEPGQELPLPLVIEVAHPFTQQPMRGAPLEFIALTSGAGLSMNAGGPKTNSLALSTSATGQATVFASLPNNAAGPVEFQVTAGSAEPLLIQAHLPSPDIATPLFSLSSGFYRGEQETSITTDTHGAVLHYTLDGSDPTENDPILAANETLPVTTRRVIRARAFLAGVDPSPIAEARYLIDHALFAGGATSFAFQPDGTTFAWGDDRLGQCGLGSTAGTRSLTPNPALHRVETLFVGATSVGARSNDGSLLVWGDNQHGQLGDGTQTDRLTPAPLSADDLQLAFGRHHSLGIEGDQTLRASGADFRGQLGEISPLQQLTSVAAGVDFSVALTVNGEVYTWGGNHWGQLGRPSPEPFDPAPVTLPLPPISALEAGAFHTLALTHDGSVYSWGSNWFGQLGAGDLSNHSEPVQVVGLQNIVQVSAGDYHSLALAADGTLYAWGANWFGQVGDGTYANPSSPVVVATGILSIASGSGHTLALQLDGTVVAWGDNRHGQLGFTDIHPVLQPTLVPALNLLQEPLP